MFEEDKKGGQKRGRGEPEVGAGEGGT